MKIAIVGSRNYPDKKQVEKYVKSLPKDTVIVSGGAIGVDTWAEKAAKSRGMKTEIYLPKWDVYGKSAGFRRNSTIVIAADKVVAFTTGSAGTANTISLARKYGKELEIYRANVQAGIAQKTLL